MPDKTGPSRAFFAPSNPSSSGTSSDVRPSWFHSRGRVIRRPNFECCYCLLCAKTRIAISILAKPDPRWWWFCGGNVWPAAMLISSPQTTDYARVRGGDAWCVPRIVFGVIDCLRY
jgi:hypothetical protein